MPGAVGVLPVNPRDLPVSTLSPDTNRDPARKPSPHTIICKELPMDTPFPDLLQFIVACVLALGAITLAVVCVGASKTPIAGDHH